MKIKIKQIELKDRLKTDDFPHSGFFIASQGVMQDVVFVNKESKTVIFVSPYEAFLKADSMPVIEDKERTSEVKEGFVNQDFVLEFAGILLNRKK